MDDFEENLAAAGNPLGNFGHSEDAGGLNLTEALVGLIDIIYNFQREYCLKNSSQVHFKKILFLGLKLTLLVFGGFVGLQV